MHEGFIQLLAFTKVVVFVGPPHALNAVACCSKCCFFSFFLSFFFCFLLACVAYNDVDNEY